MNPYDPPPDPKAGRRPWKLWLFAVFILVALPAGVIACFGTCTAIYWAAGQEYGDLGWAGALRWAFIVGAVVGICVMAGVLCFALSRKR